MGVLPDSLALMYSLQPGQDAALITSLLQALLKQAVERIARLREVCSYIRPQALLMEASLLVQSWKGWPETSGHLPA